MKIKKTQGRVTKATSRIKNGKVSLIDLAVVILNVKGEEYIREKATECIRYSTDMQFSEIYKTIMPVSDVVIAEKEDKQQCQKK